MNTHPRTINVVALLLILPLVPLYGADYQWNSGSFGSWTSTDTSVWLVNGSEPSMTPGETDNIITPAQFGSMEIRGSFIINDMIYNSSSSWGAYARAGNRELTINGVLSKNGSGTLTLRSENTTDRMLALNVGSLDVLGGTLLLGNSNVLADLNVTGATTVATGSTLNVSTNSGGFSGGVTMNGGTFIAYGAGFSGGVTVAGLSGSSGSVQGTGTAVLTLNGASGSSNYSGTIDNGTGTLAVTKTGGSTQVLSGANTYTGATSVQQGSLLINGSLASGSAVSVVAGSTLGGAGTINGTVSVDGTLSPGETIGKLTVANSVILNTGSSFAVSLGGTQPGTEYDQLVITGASNGLSLDGSNDLTLALNSFPSSVGDQFTIADVQGTDPARLSGIFESLNGVTTDLSQGASFSLDNMIFRISYTAEGNIFENAGNNIMLEVVQVPEPSVVQVALLSGIGFAIVYGRRRDRNVPSISVA